MKATFQISVTLLLAVFFITSTSSSAPLRFEAPCPTSFEEIPVTPQDTRPAIDRLVDLESQLEGVERSRIATRQADGVISILKVYEKHNEGGGGALKKFANLCD